MQKKRPVGVIVLGALLVFGSLFQLRGLSIETYRFLFQPLPQRIIQFRFYLSIIMLILGAVTGIGLCFFKEIFRRMAIFIGFYILYNYLIEGPLWIYKNLCRYVNLTISSEGISLTHLEYLKIWAPIVGSFAVEFCFSLLLIFYLTRPKVKERFS